MLSGLVQNFTDYTIGMSLYRQKNWMGRWVEPYEMAKAIWVEFLEIFEELFQLKLWAAFLELWDVWHGVVNMILILILGEWALTPYPYWVIYFLTPFTSWKHASRYTHKKCVRSENHCRKKDHVCCH